MPFFGIQCLPVFLILCGICLNPILSIVTCICFSKVFSICGCIDFSPITSKRTTSKMSFIYFCIDCGKSTSITCFIIFIVINRIRFTIITNIIFWPYFMIWCSIIYWIIFNPILNIVNFKCTFICYIYCIYSFKISSTSIYSCVNLCCCIDTSIQFSVLICICSYRCSFKRCISHICFFIYF